MRFYWLWGLSFRELNKRPEVPIFVVLVKDLLKLSIRGGQKLAILDFLEVQTTDLLSFLGSFRHGLLLLLSLWSFGRHIFFN